MTHNSRGVGGFPNSSGPRTPHTYFEVGEREQESQRQLSYLFPAPPWRSLHEPSKSRCFRDSNTSMCTEVSYAGHLAWKARSNEFGILSSHQPQLHTFHYTSGKGFITTPVKYIDLDLNYQPSLVCTDLSAISSKKKRRLYSRTLGPFGSAAALSYRYTLLQRREQSIHTTHLLPYRKARPHNYTHMNRYISSARPVLCCRSTSHGNAAG